MKVILKMVKPKEKEYFIILMAEDTKVILKMIKEKVKEQSIIIMAIDKWAISLMKTQQEIMYYLKIMEKLKLSIINI